MLIHARGAHRSERDSWNSLKLFLFYRIGIAALLLLLYFTSAIPFRSDQSGSGLFAVVAFALLGANLMLIPPTLFGLMTFRRLVVSMVLLDILAFTMLTHASTGLESGLALLMVPSIAGASLLLPGLIAPVFAGLATLAVLLESLYAYFFTNAAANFILAGIQGLIFFAVALIATKLARNAQASEARAKQRDTDLANLAQLNTLIVEQMDTGVIVTADDGRVRLINQAAWRILGDPDLPKRIQLATLSASLYAGMSHWRMQDGPAVQTFKANSPTGVDFEARFIRIGADRQQSTLIFLHDLSDRSRALQEIKLAALGRLTASIAHEIRNPLGAISHAAQLLQESSAMETGDQRLVSIIYHHAQRMNRLIENILNLSRRKTPNTQTFALGPWLEETITAYRQQYQLTQARLSLNSLVHQHVRADAEQLHQVLWNLLRNAQMHHPDPAHLHIEIRAGDGEEGRQAFVDVIDNGPGIAPEQEERLFEPFFTTNDAGTGLGLFLARELCEANGGTLEHRTLDDGRTCFRIRIPLAQTELTGSD